jgi:cell division septum initiation protein DivIVA
MRGDGENVARRSDAPHDLPVGFRGYDRVSTDALLAKLEARSTALTRERDDLWKQVNDLTTELDDYRKRSEAVADALVTAQRMAIDLRTAAEAEIAEQRREVDGLLAVAEADLAEQRRELEGEREKLVDAGNEIRAEAREEATEIVREARIRADRLIDEVLDALRVYEGNTDEFLSESRTKLVSLVRELIDRIPGTAPSTPDEVSEPVETEIVAEADETSVDSAAA